jgi:hypothetical protein
MFVRYLSRRLTSNSDNFIVLPAGPPNMLVVAIVRCNCVRSLITMIAPIFDTECSHSHIIEMMVLLLVTLLSLALSFSSLLARQRWRWHVGNTGTAVIEAKLA